MTTSVPKSTGVKYLNNLFFKDTWCDSLNLTTLISLIELLEDTPTEFPVYVVATSEIPVEVNICFFSGLSCFCVGIFSGHNSKKNYIFYSLYPF